MHNDSTVPSRVIAAAKGLIARLGYEQTSTAAIAREAGTSESQLVRYFTSKSGLLEAILNQAWGALNQQITEIIAGAAHEREAIARIFKLMIEAFARDPELAFIFLFEGRRVRGQEIALSKGFLSFYELVHQLIGRAQESGSLRSDLSADVLGSALLGCAEGMMRDRLVAQRMGQPFNAPDADIEATFRCIIDALAPPSC